MISFKCRKKNCKPKIIYSSKYAFKDKQALRESITGRPFKMPNRNQRHMTNYHYDNM